MNECPFCGYDRLAVLRSLEKKICLKKGCRKETPFKLKPDQAPLLGPARLVGTSGYLTPKPTVIN